MSTETRRFARRPAGPARGSIAGEWTSPAVGSVPLTGWSLWEEWESDPTAGGVATLADGDYGDVVVSGGGTAMTLDMTLDTIPDPVASVDFAQQQALRMRIENRTSDPGAPAEGEIWLRTDL